LARVRRLLPEPSRLRRMDRLSERSGYIAIGSVCNLAARLCRDAKDGQLLVAQLVAVTVEETTALEEIGALAVKGLTQPVVAFNVSVHRAARLPLAPDRGERAGAFLKPRWSRPTGRIPRHLAGPGPSLAPAGIRNPSRKRS
jgi:hypothetical protein